MARVARKPTEPIGPEPLLLAQLALVGPDARDLIALLALALQHVREQQRLRGWWHRHGQHEGGVGVRRVPLLRWERQHG
jgi:hypothetical protein